MTSALRWMHWICRVLLAGIFIYSGYVKFQSPLQFSASIARYKLVPDSLIFPLATYLPWVEIALGVLLLSGWKIRAAAIGAAGLLFSFTIILTITYLRGIDADCGCFGFGDRISPRTIGRDLLMVLPALFLIFERRIGRMRPEQA
jgi:putative oxidoreductase